MHLINPKRAAGAFLFALVAFAPMACEGNQTSLGVTPKTVSVPAEGGSSKIAFSAMTDWTATTSADWITLSSLSGEKGDVVVTVTVGKNESTTPRTGTVTISMPSFQISDIVTVSQDGATAIPDPTLTLSAHETHLGADGGSAQITVKTNQNWSAGSSVPWISANPASGIAGELSVTLTVEANATLEPREGEVTFTAGTLTEKVKITQDARKPSTLSLSSDAFTFASEGGRSNLVVTANVNWTASSNSDWLTIAPAEGIAGAMAAVVETSAYQGEEARTGAITFTGGDVTAVLMVTQLAPVKTDDPVLELSTGTLSFSDEAGSNDITVIGNVDWTAASDVDWLSVSPAQGTSGSATVTISVTQNAGQSDRGGKVSFTSGNLVRTLQVNQKGKVVESAPTINLSPVSLTFSTTGGTAEVSVTADAAWTASSDAAWLTVDSTSGTAGTKTIKVSATTNEHANDRSGAITFTAGATSVRLSVSQKGRGQISVGGITGSLGDWGDGGNADFNKNN